MDKKTKTLALGLVVGFVLAGIYYKGSVSVGK